MIMLENVSPEGFKGQIWNQSIFPLISLNFQFLILLWTDMSPRYQVNEIGNIDMVGYLKSNDNVGKWVAKGF